MVADLADDAWHEPRWGHAGVVGGPSSSEALADARQLAAAAYRFPDTRRALAELLEQWSAWLAGNHAERRMALRLSEQRLRLVRDPPPAAGGTAEPAGADSGAGGSGGEPGAPFPGEEPAGDPGDFYNNRAGGSRLRPAGAGRASRAGARPGTRRRRAV